MATTTQHTTTDNTSFGIGRMSDEEYEGEFSGGAECATPRPGTGTSDNAAAAVAAAAARAYRIFARAAKASATEIKRKRSPNSRTDYRMAANLVIQNAFSELEKRLDRLRDSATPPPNVMSEADFSLLKQAIGNFSVRIVVHDSITRCELKQMQAKCQDELVKHAQAKCQAELEKNSGFATATAAAAAFIPSSHQEKHDDLVELNRALFAEMRRMSAQNENVPSQHAQVAHSSGKTLQHILSPQTLRRKFLSLNALTRAIREDLLAFLTQDLRSGDRAIVVQQIKDSCVARKKQ
jgi:hypothetical protein